MLHIYIDGSSTAHNKKGGYGIVVFNDNNNLIDCDYQYFDNVTNNQMELTACLKALELLNTEYPHFQKATIYSDSSYCINILTSWMFSWSKNNWKNSKQETIKNLNIISSLYRYYTQNFSICQIIFTKVDGHKGLLGNELADALATKNLKKFKKLILENKVKIKTCKN